MSNYGFYGIDIYYILLVVPALIISLLAQFKVKSTFNKYSKIRSQRGRNAAEVAQEILRRNHINDVQVEQTAGNLTDHYDPRSKTLRLSQSVYESNSIAAVGVAAHEVGHAIQHNQGYQPLKLRSTLVPTANIGSQAGPWLAIIGIWFQFSILTYIGLVLFSGAILFYLITLPVEFNASRRAIKSLDEYALVRDEEISHIRKVLGAAAMTYVASALVAIASFLRLLLRSRRR